MPKKAKPEPLQPGDAQIAAEEVVTYYTSQVERARTELERAQARFDREQSTATEAIERFHTGARLPEIDAWSIEVNAGNVSELGADLLAGRSTDRTAYDRGQQRRAATKRWLRSEGYEPIRYGKPMTTTEQGHP